LGGPSGDHYLHAVTARRHHIAAGFTVCALVLGACGGGGDDEAAGDTDTDESTTTTASDDGGAFAVAEEDGASLVAEAIPDEIQIYATASEDEPTTALPNPNENGAPLVFLVDQEEGDWLKVHLPIRPNGSTGYIRAADVNLVSNPYRIDIELSEHMLTVTESGEVIAEEPIGVGTEDTPTPGGVYYVKELLQPTDPDGAYGPYAYGLSGYSNVLDDFAGGTGVIGIHGTNEPELIGTDVSHGCIRMSNEGITELAGILPLGTPVHIEA
jgi:lipoprotein-anchoring transpeptidase ErfK/SrfK